MNNKTIENIFRQKVFIVWSILFFITIISSFITIHEVTHAIRIDSPTMLCIGLGDNVGKVYHEGLYSDEEINKEELIANIVPSVILIIYLALTFYMIAYYNPNKR